MNMNIFRESLILNVLIKVYSGLINSIINSKTFSVFNRIFDYMENAISESFSVKILFNNKDDDSILKNSFIFKILASPETIITFLREKTGQAVCNTINESIVLKALKTAIKLIHKLLYLKIKTLFKALYEGSIVMKLLASFFIIKDEKNVGASQRRDNGILPVAVFVVVGLIPFIPTMLAAGLVIICMTFFGFKVFINKEFKIEYTMLDVFILIFSGTLLYGSITSYMRNSSIKIALIYLVFIMFYMIIVNVIKSKKQLYPLTVVLIFTASVVALYGIYQNFFGAATTQSWIDEEMFKDIKSRVYSTFDNPNVLGEYLVLIIPISLALLLTAKKWLSRIVYIGTTSLMAVCLILTWSRGSWLGTLIALVIFAALADRRLVTLGFGGMLVLPFIVPQTIIGRISSIGNLKDTSSAYRVAIWLGSINVIKKYWPSGIGLGSEVFSRIYPRNAISGAAYALHAHNLYLQIFVETGIVGILSFSILIFMFYRSTISAYLRTKDKFLSTLLASICAGMTGYLFQGLTDNIWYNYRMVLIFWMLLGFSAVAVRLVKSEAEAQADA